MALTHKISDAVNMRIDRDEKGHPVIEIEFKFVRYRLVLDNMDKTQQLQGLLKMLTDRDSKVQSSEEQEMPKFYKKDKSPKP